MDSERVPEKGKCEKWKDNKRKEVKERELERMS